MKKIKTEPFDVAQYSASPEAKAELLNDALASGNAGYVGQAFGVITAARRDDWYARRVGVAAARESKTYQRP